MIRLLCSLTFFFAFTVFACEASPKISSTAGADAHSKPSRHDHPTDEQNNLEFQLKPFRAKYEIKASGVTVGELSRTLSISKTLAYDFSSEAKTSGLAALFKSSRTLESSLGHLLNGKIRPEHYAHARFKGSKEKSEDLIFDHKQNRLDITRRGVISQRTLTAGGLDKLSYQLQLMIDLAAGNNELAYTVETSTKVKAYAAERGAIERISTPQGSYVTERIEQRNNGDNRTTFWCAEALQFLPIKVMITEGDDKTEIVLSEFEYSAQ